MAGRPHDSRLAWRVTCADARQCQTRPQVAFGRRRAGTADMPGCNSVSSLSHTSTQYGGVRGPLTTVSRRVC
eukprot:357080-Chlamydomonas_euryale.AAC.6